MTVKEAIERLKYDREMCYFNPDTGEYGEPYDEECREMAQALDIAIEALKNESSEKQSKWIPVSERLPEETKYLELYLVSIGDWVGLGYFTKGKFWRNAFFQDGLHSFDFPVEAWMPVPEAYNGCRRRSRMKRRMNNEC